MNLAAIYLGFGGLVTVGFGIAYLIRSERMARMVEIVLPSVRARADYRAIYGGAQIGIGLFFLVAAWRTSWRQAGLAGLALFVLGFGVVRLFSLALERAGRDVQWIVGAIETVLGLIAFYFAATG
jgi:inner membrane protein involved in colicin E2 resistance